MTQIKPLSQVTREHIAKVLSTTGGDQAQACAVLGISRAQLKRLISQHQISTPQPAGPAPDAPPQSPEPSPVPKPSPGKE